MGLPAVNLNVALVVETCITCGCQFGVPAGLHEHRKAHHERIYCPSGHYLFYQGESDAERNARLLREEQERHRRTIERVNEAERERDSLKKRIANGACPCCKRSFSNLARHMKTKHPGFKPAR